MNKKNISLALCGVMAAASVFAFAGCNEDNDGHKHTYNSSYVLATCETDGYTLHTCSDCGYKYADEFVEAYGHAYEYCVGLALHEDGPAAQSDWNDNLSHVLSELIGDPLSAVSKKQEELCKVYLSDLMKLTLQDNQPDAEQEKITFHVVTHHDCAYCDDGGVSTATVEVPVRLLTPDASFEMPDISLSSFETVVKGEESLPDDWHDESHGASEWATPVNLVGNKSDVFSAPTPYEIDPDTKAVRISAKKLENAGLPEGVQKILELQQLVMSDAYEEIGANVFAQCSGLKRADLPLGIKKIGENAFGTAAFDYVILPETLESIGSNAFGDCKNMKYVFYMGTPDEWDRIAIDSGNDGLKSVKRYYYSKEKPATQGNYWHFVNENPVLW